PGPAGAAASRSSTDVNGAWARGTTAAILTSIMGGSVEQASKGFMSSALLVAAVAAIVLAGLVLRTDRSETHDTPAIAAAPPLGTPIAAPPAPALAPADPPPSESGVEPEP